MVRIILKLLMYLVKTFIRGPPPPPPPPPPPDTSRISTLPLELFLPISNNLPIESQFSLSLTCRRAYHSLQRDWPSTIRALSPERRFRCRLLLASELPDHAACGTCHKIFRVNEKDFPIAGRSGQFVRHGCTMDKEWRYLAAQFGYFGDEYDLTHDHVQLALKYTRLGIREKYLEALMRPWPLSDVTSKRRILLHSEYEVKCAHTPRIVGGRFLVESVWEACRRDIGPVHGYGLAFAWPNIFNHLVMLFQMGGLTPGREADDPWAPFQHDWQDFVAPKTLVKSFWCRPCRLEFRCEIAYSKWVLRCWMDLGTETEPVRHRDPWRLPVESLLAHNRDVTLPIPCGPGPIETMYNSAGGGLTEG